MNCIFFFPPFVFVRRGRNWVRRASLVWLTPWQELAVFFLGEGGGWFLVFCGSLGFSFWMSDRVLSIRVVRNSTLIHLTKKPSCIGWRKGGKRRDSFGRFCRLFYFFPLSLSFWRPCVGVVELPQVLTARFSLSFFLQSSCCSNYIFIGNSIVVTRRRRNIILLCWGTVKEGRTDGRKKKGWYHRSIAAHQQQLRSYIKIDTAEIFELQISWKQLAAGRVKQL